MRMDNTASKSEATSPSKECKPVTLEFTHSELVNLTKEAVAKIIGSDPLLDGLPLDVTLEEIKAQTAVAQGQAITLYVDRGSLAKLSIVVKIDLGHKIQYDAKFFGIKCFILFSSGPTEKHDST